MGFYLVQFLTGLSDASALFLVASGLSLIFGVTRIVNFAHGSFYMVGAYVAYFLISALPAGAFLFWAGILMAALTVGLLGVLVETLLLRRLYRAPELFLLMGTFGIVLILQDQLLMRFKLLKFRPNGLALTPVMNLITGMFLLKPLLLLNRIKPRQQLP